jgi:hypothetical protein
MRHSQEISLVDGSLGKCPLLSAILCVSQYQDASKVEGSTDVTNEIAILFNLWVIFHYWEKQVETLTATNRDLLETNQKSMHLEVTNIYQVEILQLNLHRLQELLDDLCNMLYERL